MEWLKKHADTVMVIGAIISSMLWMNTKFNELEKEIAIMKKHLTIFFIPDNMRL